LVAKGLALAARVARFTSPLEIARPARVLGVKPGSLFVCAESLSAD
jgi:hypothetical protein